MILEGKIIGKSDIPVTVSRQEVVKMQLRTGLKDPVGRNEKCICGSDKKFKKCCSVN